MKVVHLNNSDRDGGASIAASRINNALNKSGLDSKLLVQKKKGSDNTTLSVSNNSFSKISYLMRFLFDVFSIKVFTPNTKGRFSYPYWGVEVSNYPLIANADIINLHWVNQGFISLKGLEGLKKLGKPIVWTLHDMWAFTGGCHYSLSCRKFEQHCYLCPSLKFSGPRDASYKIFEKKSKIFEEMNLHIVTCSSWLAKEVRNSELLRKKTVTVIANPIDTEIYKPTNRNRSRDRLNLPQDKLLILFGTMTLNEKRKGFDLLVESMRSLYIYYPELKNSVEIIVFGSEKKMDKMDIPFKINYLGRLTNQNNIIDCYGAADLFVAPSIQDNLPNTVMESLACGTPVAAFNIGGMPDMIDHKENGFLAQSINAKELSEAILWLVKNNNKEDLRKYARKKVLDNFTPSQIAKNYKQLYKKLLDAKRI